MLRAAAEVVSELGYGGMSVARVTARAGVSRRTFYDLFEDREDCFMAVFEDALARIGSLIVQAGVGQRTWQGRLRAGLAMLLRYLDEQPALARVCVIDALNGGELVLERRRQVLTAFRDVVDEGRISARSGAEPPPLAAEGVIGAVLGLIHARLLERDGPPLMELLNPLMGMIVLPYHGRAAAMKELQRPTPRAPHARPAPAPDPLEGLDMRLTYRTLRVLTAIAGSPGTSNRLVAERAGVADQGQISKLLTRLEHLGLIQNTGVGAIKGEPNAWTLTPRGVEVEHVIHLQTDHTAA
jgi:AcrR family transcriptional regulator